MSSTELAECCRNRLQATASQIAPAAPIHVSVAVEEVLRRVLMADEREAAEWTADADFHPRQLRSTSVPAAGGKAALAESQALCHS